MPAFEGELATHVHLPTGARHLHLALPVEDHAFLMAFLTPAPDSTGLTHVLEHLVMCGSKRYPCRRAFFAMLGRTLSTTMNALTTEDCTAYHFATRSLADYENLLSVYLDAAFFPRLDRLDFEQEGCRVEIEALGTEREAPVRRGVVLNEMLGLMSEPEEHVRQALNRCAVPPHAVPFQLGRRPLGDTLSRLPGAEGLPPPPLPSRQRGVPERRPPGVGMAARAAARAGAPAVLGRGRVFQRASWNVRGAAPPDAAPVRRALSAVA